MGQPVFVSISKKNYVNASDIHRVWQNDDKCMVMFRGDNYFTTITQEQFETLTRIIDRLTIKDEPTHVDSAANVTSSPGPDTLDAEFRQWATEAGLEVAESSTSTARCNVKGVAFAVEACNLVGHVILHVNSAYPEWQHIGTCTRADCLTILRMLGWKQK